MTGIVWYPAGLPRRRHMRWLPIAALAMTAAGVAWHVAVPEARRFGGDDLVVLAFFLTVFVQLLGPLREPTRTAPLDEREQLLRARANLAGAATVAILAIGGALYFSLTSWFPVWVPASHGDWKTICFALLTIYRAVPPLHASWTTRPLDDDEEA
jgi:hypothetical protein